MGAVMAAEQETQEAVALTGGDPRQCAGRSNGIIPGETVREPAK